MSLVGDAEQTDRDADGESGSAPGPSHGGRTDGLYLYALARSRSFRSTAIPGTNRIRYRDVDAIVKSVAFVPPDLDVAALGEHQRVNEAIMRGATVLPMPCGVVFRDRRELIRWIEDQYLAIDEALAFLDGHWELRVHLNRRGEAETRREPVELAAHVYAELRRSAHAALPLPLPGRERRLFSAAFLVRRSDWVEFVERAEDLVSAESGLSLDVTGPWPAYDFVRVAR